VNTSLTIPPVDGTAVQFACDFETSVRECGFVEQNALGDQPGRATIVSSVSRTGSSALRLHTEPGDSNVHGSGSWERDDVLFPNDGKYGVPGGPEEWWAWSVLFPDDYVYPNTSAGSGTVLDFHHDNIPLQADQTPMGVITASKALYGPGNGGLQLWIYGGTSEIERARIHIPDPYGVVDEVKRNAWYDFVFRVKWSTGNDGYMQMWLNGKRVANYSGPTSYPDKNYLKLADYHAAFGVPVSVIYDRIVRGRSAAAVALTPLEGVQ